MRTRQLFKQPERECVQCRIKAPTRRMALKPGDRVMLSIQANLTRKGYGKRMTRSCGSVCICEDCLIKLATNDRAKWMEQPPSALWDSLKTIVFDCLQGMVEDDLDFEPSPAPTKGRTREPECLL